MSTKLSKTSLINKIAYGFAIILVACITYTYVDKHFKTVQQMSQTSVLLNRKLIESELLARFGKPQIIYQNWNDVPAKFRRGLSEQVTTNSLFYYYSKEGIPCWYFIVAVDSGDNMIKSGVATKY
jgi:hypothetical protein